MINEWRDYYNKEYNIFSINNEIMSDQYFSTKHILNTYQSKIEFNIENIENFSFKNDDMENSSEINYANNYSQHDLELEDSNNPKVYSSSKNSKLNLKINENIINANKEKIENKENNEKDTNINLFSQNSPEKKSEGNKVIDDELLKEEYFKPKNIIDLNKEKNTTLQDVQNPIRTLIQEKEEITNDEQDHIDPKRVINITEEKKKSVIDGENKIAQKASQESKFKHEKNNSKGLKIDLDNQDSPKDEVNFHENNHIYERKKDKYRKLLSSLKARDPEEEKEIYYSRIDKGKNREIKSEKLNREEIEDSEKIIDIKENKLFTKDNENENFNNPNSVNSSRDYNLNSDNNDMTDFEKFTKIYSRAQSYTTRSRDDEIRSLNDKLYSYKYQNKIILDENKKLLEIINIFKILQNLENSKKNNLNISEQKNEKLEGYCINRDNKIVDTNNMNIFRSNKENEIKDDKMFQHNENEKLLENLEIIHFEKRKHPKNEKKFTNNIDFATASKFINATHRRHPNNIDIPLEFHNTNKISDKNLNLNDINNSKGEFKANKIESFIINNRYNNVNDNNFSNNNILLYSVNSNLSEMKNSTNQANFEIYSSELKNKIFEKDNHNYLKTKHSFYNNDCNNNLINYSLMSPKSQKIILTMNDTRNTISPENKECFEYKKNQKKTYIKIEENLNDKGSYYNNNVKSKNLLNQKIININTGIKSTRKTNNKISYIYTNNNSALDSNVNSNSIKSSYLTPKSDIIFSSGNSQNEDKIKPHLVNQTTKNNDYEQNKVRSNYYQSNDQNNKYKTDIDNKIRVSNYNFDSFNPNSIDSSKNHNSTNESNIKDDKYIKNYSNLIYSLEKYKELNDRLIETLENEKDDIRVDVHQRKKDVEYLEQILSYISSFDNNNNHKESKDLIPFYLIDKRKLFENMVKYLYSKDEITHSTKHKNIRLYKIQKKLNK